MLAQSGPCRNLEGTAWRGALGPWRGLQEAAGLELHPLLTTYGLRPVSHAHCSSKCSSRMRQAACQGAVMHLMLGTSPAGVCDSGWVQWVDQQQAADAVHLLSVGRRGAGSPLWHAQHIQQGGALGLGSL